MPLIISGEGLGPAVQLSVERLNVGQIFKTTTHDYEIIAVNQGPIIAHCEIKPPETAFGRCFHITPVNFTLHSGGYQPLKVTFVAHRLGMFEEVIMMTVEGIKNQSFLLCR